MGTDLADELPPIKMLCAEDPSIKRTDHTQLHHFWSHTAIIRPTPISWRYHHKNSELESTRVKN